MHPRRLLALPILAGLAILLADRLLWDAPLGLGAALLALALGAAVVARGTPRASAWAAVAGASLLLAIDPGPLAAVLAVLALGAAGLLARGWRATAPAAAARAVTAALLAALPRVVRDAHAVSRLRGRPLGLAAWFVPLLGAAGFLVLFGIGNPVIGQWWSRLGDWLAEIGLPAPGRIVLWWVALLGVWALARARDRALAMQAAVAAVREPDALWTVRCLIAFNLAFVVQNACDLLYLWGGAGLPEGMTYAAYAHRGAYPLVAAALLAGAFVLLCVRPGGLAERSPAARWLVLAFLLQTVVLAVSSWWRLDLYVEAYGLSRWRLAALAWIGLVALGLALIAWRIWRQRSGRWLVEANAWTVAAVLLLAALGDGDGLIAGHNIARAMRGDPAFDLAYIESLGVAALPALERLDRHRTDRETATAIARLRGELHDQLSDWRGWSWRRWAVREALATAPSAPRAQLPPAAR